MSGNNGNTPIKDDPVKLEPHSTDAEEAVLGSILINPDAYDEASAIITREMFFIERNGMVWGAIKRLVDRNEEVDNVTVVSLGFHPV